MVLISNIVIDKVSQTAVLDMTSDGSLDETITYSLIDNIVTFTERGELFISGQDFIDMIEQLKILEVAILFNFNPNQFQTEPYNQIITENTNDSDSGQWKLICSSLGDPLIIEYTAILSNITMQLHKRGSPKTILFSE